MNSTPDQEIVRLRRAVEELSILNEIATAINSTMHVHQIVDLIVRKCLKLLDVEQAAVMLLDEKKDEKPFQTMVRLADTSSLILPFRLDAQLTGWMLKNQKPLLINAFQQDDRFKEFSVGPFPIRSLLAVPLLSKGRMTGLLTVFNKKSEEGYTQEDQRLLSIIGAQSAQIIENTRLLEKEKTLIQMQKEMQMAYSIQINLLPKENPMLPHYEIAGVSVPAQVVGGDYFDFIPINANRLAVCLGDVSGKGLSAALLMANLQATIRGQTLLNPPPKDCLCRSNRLLFQCTDPQKFATLFYGILDIENHQFCYSNAGHNRPFFFGDNQEPRSVEGAGLALSFLENVSYPEDQIGFNPDDVLLIYSDGITEAMNAKDEEYGEQRLMDLVHGIKRETAQEIINRVLDSVNTYVEDRQQMDDMTLVVIKRKKD
jgi:sigma-B regulation protein RsbU (phosphoserine phosphatase)